MPYLGEDYYYDRQNRPNIPIWADPCFAFLDADNILKQLHAHLRQQRVPQSLFEHFSLRRLIEKQNHDRIFVYSAVAEGDSPNPWLEEIENAGRFILRTGRLVSKSKRPKQEGVDVKLAIDAVSHAVSGTMRSCWIYSGDGDFLPLVSALTERGVYTSVCSFSNPERGYVAPRLRAKADHYMQVDNKLLFEQALAREVQGHRAQYGTDFEPIRSGFTPNDRCEIELLSETVPAFKKNDDDGIVVFYVNDKGTLFSYRNTIIEAFDIWYSMHRDQILKFVSSNEVFGLSKT